MTGVKPLDTTAGQPHVLVARSVFGRGVPFMERQVSGSRRGRTRFAPDRIMMRARAARLSACDRAGPVHCADGPPPGLTSPCAPTTL